MTNLRAIYIGPQGKNFLLYRHFFSQENKTKNVLHQTKQLWQFEAILCPNCTVFSHIAYLLSGKAVSAVSS